MYTHFWSRKNLYRYLLHCHSLTFMVLGHHVMPIQWIAIHFNHASFAVCPHDHLSLLIHEADSQTTAVDSEAMRSWPSNLNNSLQTTYFSLFSYYSLLHEDSSSNLLPMVHFSATGDSFDCYRPYWPISSSPWCPSASCHSYQSSLGISHFRVLLTVNVLLHIFLSLSARPRTRLYAYDMHCKDGSLEL